jgi:hypothetical protein
MFSLGLLHLDRQERPRQPRFPMSYQGIRQEPIFDVLPGLEKPAPASVAGPVPQASRPSAAWLALAVTSLLLALPALAPGRPRVDPDITGSISQPVVSAFTVEIGWGSDPAQLLAAWQNASPAQHRLLEGRMPSMVPGLDPVGRAWTLTVGEFRNAAAAAARCEKLRAAGLTCEIARRDAALFRAAP